MPGSVRVLIVDDQGVGRSGIAIPLAAEPDIESVVQTDSHEDAIFEARRTKPDVILLTVMMRGGDGLNSIGQLLQEQPDAKVVVLAMRDDPSAVRQAFAAGASGYVLTDRAESEVVAAVREVVSGGKYVHPELGARLAAAEAARRSMRPPLSEREREVLRLIALGHTNQEIGRRLFISVRTAEMHRAHIMQKLHFTTRAELVRYALAEGMLEG